MKITWERLTLMRFASDRDDGRIPILEALFFVAVMAVFFWIVAELGDIFF